MFDNGKHGLIGVDLGAGAVKLAQVMRQRSRLAVVDAAVVRRPETIEGGSADHPKADTSTDEMLGGLSLAQRIRGRRAAGVMSMNDCEYHSLRVKRKDLSAENLRSELAAAIPMRWQTRTCDAWSIEHATDNPKFNLPNLGVVSAETKRADHLAADFVDAGLHCETLDTAPTALARAMRLMVGNKDVSLAAVDLGFRRATLCIVRNGQPTYVRCLKKCGYDEIPRLLAKKLNCTAAESIELLDEYGILTDDPNRQSQARAIEEAIRHPLDRLRQELLRTLQYLQSHRRNMLPTGMVLFGAGATISGLSPWLTKAVGVETRTWQPNPEAISLPNDLTVPVVLLAQAITASTLVWERK